MQSGQVSVWVPVVVALLAGVFGVVGVVIGQILNARRERTREDVRWERDREQRELDRVHDYRKHWLDQRITFYSELLAECEAWMEYITRFRRRPKGTVEPQSDDLEKLKAFELKLRQQEAKSKLIGSDLMELAIMNFTVSVYMANAYFLEPEMPNEDLNKWIDLARDQLKEVVRVFRRDVGLAVVDGDGQPDSYRRLPRQIKRREGSSSRKMASPSPPSEKTSSP
ncbi:hypothetical protein JOF56_000865 [Kibdelosporangium banguiense]|uniref:DUF4760 domain-containing protein n=1 Tax=Kibdelosporangium banguiense TaxID=1365924 RepID=A0ABS4T8Q7_9PSEU|nr:hypothetical protein [Kibdelosporangium banguiense]MBP2320480.1 hypothetical protein [Kibdelosporangium banguiense]